MNESEKSSMDVGQTGRMVDNMNKWQGINDLHSVTPLHRAETEFSDTKPSLRHFLNS